MVFGWQKRADCAKTKTANPVPVLVLDWSKAAQEELVERVRVVVGMALNSDIAGTWEKGEKPYERIARASIRELSK